MEEKTRSERLDEEQVRAKVREAWNELQGWNARCSTSWIPEANSTLAEDDAARTRGMHLSHLSWASIASGTEHLLTASAYMLNFGPTIFSMQTLLRTAMLGSGQVVWMLSPEDRAIRLERASMVSHDAYLNQLWWVRGIKHPHPDSFRPEEFPDAQRRLLAWLGGNASIQVKATKVIESAADYAYQGDPVATTECLASWRILSCVAHALPWELSVRTETTEQIELDGRRGTATRASWANLQAAFSVAHGFTYTAWKLLDRRATAK